MLAYFETIASGLVPVRVLSISVKGATLHVTGARPGYARHKVLFTSRIYRVIPRGAVRKFRSSPFPKILPFDWSKVLFNGQYSNAPQWRRR